MGALWVEGYINVAFFFSFRFFPLFFPMQFSPTPDVQEDSQPTCRICFGGAESGRTLAPNWDPRAPRDMRQCASSQGLISPCLCTSAEIWTFSCDIETPLSVSPTHHYPAVARFFPNHRSMARSFSGFTNRFRDDALCTHRMSQYVACLKCQSTIFAAQHAWSWLGWDI